MTKRADEIELILLACRRHWPTAEGPAIRLAENAWCQPALAINDNLYASINEPDQRDERLGMAARLLKGPAPRWGDKRRAAWDAAFTALLELKALRIAERP